LGTGQARKKVLKGFTKFWARTKRGVERSGLTLHNQPGKRESHAKRRSYLRETLTSTEKSQELKKLLRRGKEGKGGERKYIKL